MPASIKGTEPRMGMSMWENCSLTVLGLLSQQGIARRRLKLINKDKKLRLHILAESHPQVKAKNSVPEQASLSL